MEKNWDRHSSKRKNVWKKIAVFVIVDDDDGEGDDDDDNNDDS